MLQITTGRFFTSDDLHRTKQQTVLYSNLQVLGEVETAVGCYAPAGSSYDVAAAVYSVEQVLEASDETGRSFTLIAVNPEQLAQDFAALVSFCWQGICTLDSALVARLTQSHRPPVGVHSLPSHMVPRVFDREVRPTQQEIAFLSRFIEDLVKLERQRYSSVIRAIRRYVVGLHRIGDDPPLAYTLLVASIESLAQSYDEFVPAWTDLETNKRTRIDRALADAAHATREAVHDAVLEVEHVALARRYREFALAHLPSPFFREEAIGRSRPARKVDLAQALSHAYSFRSRLIHRLEDLPGMLTYVPQQSDTVLIDGKPALTFAGLTRVVRRVILSFVEISPKLDSEDYNYRRDLPGVITAQMAPKYWIWRAEGYHTRSARRYLGGFLSELEGVLTGRGEGLTNITPVLEVIEERVPSLAPRSRVPMVALYLLYHRHLVVAQHRPDAEAFLAGHVALLDDPSIESLTCHAVLLQPTGWEPSITEATRKAYLDQRFHKNGLRLGPVLEGALTLQSAVAFRQAGNEGKVLELVSEVVENVPGREDLIAWEARARGGVEVSLDWRDVLLPPQDPDTSEDAR